MFGRIFKQQSSEYAVNVVDSTCNLYFVSSSLYMSCIISLGFGNSFVDPAYFFLFIFISIYLPLKYFCHLRYFIDEQNGTFPFKCTLSFSLAVFRRSIHISVKQSVFFTTLTFFDHCLSLLIYIIDSPFFYF